MEQYNDLLQPLRARRKRHYRKTEHIATLRHGWHYPKKGLKYPVKNYRRGPLR